MHSPRDKGHQYAKSRHERHRHRSHHDKRKHDKTISRKEVDKNFSFVKYRHEFNSLLNANPNLINDSDDFWKFVQKYEALEEKKNERNQILDSSVSNRLGVPLSYNITHSLNFSLASPKELFDRFIRSDILTDSRVDKFKDIVITYLGFKQKEKFSKLKKLRNEQENLPVAKYRQQIIDTIKSERVVIIAGDTGCGKSTQIPQYLSDAGFGKVGKLLIILICFKNIFILDFYILLHFYTFFINLITIVITACTQPRRIACISLAKRVAFETLSENYNEVGYQIRFEKQRNQHTIITFITEGLLLRQVCEFSHFFSFALDTLQL